MLCGVAGTSVVRSAGLSVLLIGPPTNFADRLIGSPITWDYTGRNARAGAVREARASARGEEGTLVSGSGPGPSDGAAHLRRRMREAPPLSGKKMYPFTELSPGHPLTGRCQGAGLCSPGQKKFLGF